MHWSICIFCSLYWFLESYAGIWLVRFSSIQRYNEAISWKISKACSCALFCFLLWLDSRTFPQWRTLLDILQKFIWSMREWMVSSNPFLIKFHSLENIATLWMHELELVLDEWHVVILISTFLSYRHEKMESFGNCDELLFDSC